MLVLFFVVLLGFGLSGRTDVKTLVGDAGTREFDFMKGGVLSPEGRGSKVPEFICSAFSGRGPGVLFC